MLGMELLLSPHFSRDAHCTHGGGADSRDPPTEPLASAGTKIEFL